jgi:Tat protein secretion system quality control protein TatD with DNase activity
MLIDTHTHLDDARYDQDREAMLGRIGARFSSAGGLLI